MSRSASRVFNSCKATRSYASETRAAVSSRRGIKMFWFIYPWEAARRLSEAQRQLKALPWILMASGRRYQELADGKQDLSEAPPAPARAAGPSAVPARRAMETVTGPVGARGKDKGSKRRNKSCKK